MPGSTGPDLNTYSIPEVQLGDTFNYWKDVTNTAIYKLNKLKIYDIIDSGSIGATYGTTGAWTAFIKPTITEAITFSQLIRFDSGISAAGVLSTRGVTIDSGNLWIVGGITASGGLTIGGGVFVNRGISIGGGITVGTSAFITGNLQVDSSGDATFFVDSSTNRVGIGTLTPSNSRLDVRGGITADYLFASTGSTFGGTLQVNGGATFASTVDVTGLARFNGGLSAARIYASTGSTFASNLDVLGGLTATRIYASTGSTFAGTLQVNGGATFASTTDYTGLARFSGGLSASALYASTGSTFAAGVAVIGGLSASAVYVSTGSTFASSVSFTVGITAANADFTNLARFNGGLSASALYASTGSTFAGTLQVNSGATFASRVDVGGVLDVVGGATLESTLDVGGAARISGNLAVDNTTLFVNSSTDTVGVGTSSPGASLDVRGQVFAKRNAAAVLSGSGVTSAVIGVRNAGDNFEWGHTNVDPKYANVLGAQVGNGVGFIGLHTVSGWGTNNTYTTRGFTGWVIRNTISETAPQSIFQIGAVVGGSADNQTLSPYLSILPTGNVGIGVVVAGFTLDVTGTGRFTSGVTVGGRLDVGGVLDVVGGATLESTLDVVGAARFNGGLSASALYASTGSTFAAGVAVIGGLSAARIYASTGSTFAAVVDALSGVNVGYGAVGATLGVSGSVSLQAQTPIRFQDADSSNWVAFRAPATVTSNVTWTLPNADGTNGQVLSTNASGTLSWKAADGVTGSDKQIQFNQGGTLGATASLVFEYSASAGFSAGTLGVSGGMYSLGNVGIGITPGAISRRIYSNSTAKLEVRGDIRIPSNGFFVNKGTTLPSAVETVIDADENAFIAGTLAVPSGATLTINSGGYLVVM